VVSAAGGPTGIPLARTGNPALNTFVTAIERFLPQNQKGDSNDPNPDS
jgi:hypothetical protein